MLKCVACILAMMTLIAMPAFGATVPQAAVQWTVQLGVPVYNTPRVRGGEVFVDSAQPDGPNVFAMKAGKILWRYATGGAIQMPLTVGRSQVFVASDVGATHYMRALDARTGKLIWDYLRSEPPECMCSHVTHYLHQFLFAQTDGHSLYAFRPENNIPSRRWWKFQGNGARLTNPVVAGDTVIFGSADHCVYGLNVLTGKLRWKQSTGYAFVARPAISGNIAILGNRGGTIHAYRTATGQPLWSFSTNGPIDTAAFIYRHTAFIASGAGDRGIYALNINSGKQLWYVPMADYTDYSPVMVRHVLIVGSRDGTAMGINPGSGKVLWQTDLHGVPFSQPVPNGPDVVVKVGDHRLVDIAAISGKVQWAFHTSAVITAPAVPPPARPMAGMPGMPGMRMPGITESTPARTVYIGTSSGRVMALH
jgi:outer membrane protein assembly factor BamB